MTRQGYGALFAVFLLLLVEISLHTEAFLIKYRSVFAAGRLMDKLEAINNLPVNCLVVGNSRTDNGIDPFELKKITNEHFFNLGIPGANFEILYAVLLRLKNQNMLGPNKIKKVLIGLDESLFDAEDSLGYRVFFVDRFSLIKNSEYLSWIASVFRLLGFAPQMKELREPEKLLRFIRASFYDVEPIGGSAMINYGYRPGERDKFQNEEQLLRQQSGYEKDPDPLIVFYFWKIIQLLREQEVEIYVFFPPLLNRTVLYLDSENPNSAPYIEIKKKLQSKVVAILQPKNYDEFEIFEFANAGHLNHKGAIRFTKLLAQELINSK